MDINESIQLAFKYYQAGNLQQAENICKEIVNVQSNNIEKCTAEQDKIRGRILNRLLLLYNCTQNVYFRTRRRDAGEDL